MKIEKLVELRLKIKESKFSNPEKLLNFSQTKRFVKIAHSLNKTVCLDEGTWDLTHAGHVQHIRETAKHSDLVLLRLASAKYAQMFKGNGRPIEIHRDMVVSEFESVDAVWIDETAVSPHDIKSNAKILATIDPNFLTLETEDDKFDLKLETINYAHDKLGSRIQPIIFTLPMLNSTTAIINRILANFS